MSRLEELIKKLCPDGVEYKRLGEIASISRGGNFQKKDYVDSGVPCIHYGQIYTRYGMFVEETISFISEEIAKKQKFAQTGDIVMAVTSENIDDVCKCIAWLGSEMVAISGHTAIIKHNINSKYLIYYFHSEMFQKQKRRLVHGTKVMEVTPDHLTKVKIPVPPLEIQEEIVKTLDKFTNYVTELQAELQARKQQYEYYRDALLSAKNIESKSVFLSDIAKIKNGRDYKQLSEGEYPVYGSGGVMTYVNAFAYDKPSVLIPRKGSIGNLFYVEEPFWNVDTVFYTEINDEKVVPKYLFYLLQKEHLEDLNTAGGVPSLTQSVLNKVKLMIPSIDTQKRIVNVLDNFDSICSDLNIGLPAEIEARQKQYEFYRDALLTFAETGTIIAQTDRQTDIN